MRDCANGTIRDRLPDLLHERLPAAEREEVRAHVEACPDCRAELALLRTVRDSAVVPRIDTGRIVAALPAYRPVSAWTRALRSPYLRIAAAIVVVAGGVTAVSVRQKPDGPDILAEQLVSQVPAVPVTDTPLLVTEAEPPVQRSAPAVPAAELGIADGVQDLSDAELRALLEELETFETLTPAETEIVLPAMTRGRGDA